MKSQRAWVTYTVIRILSFAVPFAVVMLALPTVQFNWIIAAAVGATISLCVSFIFLRSARVRMSGDLAELRTRKDRRTEGDREEDALVDEAEAERATGEADEPAETGDAPAGRADDSAEAADEVASSAVGTEEADAADADERASAGAGDGATPTSGSAARG